MGRHKFHGAATSSLGRHKPHGTPHGSLQPPWRCFCVLGSATRITLPTTVRIGRLPHHLRPAAWAPTGQAIVATVSRTLAMVFQAGYQILPTQASPYGTAASGCNLLREIEPVRRLVPAGSKAHTAS